MTDNERLTTHPQGEEDAMRSDSPEQIRAVDFVGRWFAGTADESYLLRAADALAREFAVAIENERRFDAAARSTVAVTVVGQPACPHYAVVMPGTVSPSEPMRDPCVLAAGHDGPHLYGADGRSWSPLYPAVTTHPRRGT